MAEHLIREDGTQESPQPPSGIGLQTTGNDEENMTNVRHMLVERMDPDSGLIDNLLQLRALTYPETVKIKSEKVIFDRNEKLLEQIFIERRQQALMAALTDTGQQHLVNFVRGNGVHSQEYGTVWPLLERQTDILDVNRLNLVQVIDPCDLITRMFSKGVLSDRQQRYINSLHGDIDKAEAMLDILRRGSEENYWKTVACLRESIQEHVAEILEDGGVLVQSHVTNEGDPAHVNEEEDRIVEALANILQNATLPQYQRIRERLDLRIMRAKKDQSIVFYFYCKTLEDLLYLHELLTKGEFKQNIAEVFDLLITRRETRVSTVNWSEEEFTKAKIYFERCQKLLAQNLAETERLEEELENLLQKMRVHENRRCEQELSRGISRKEWASTMKQELLTTELKMFKEQRTRKVQEFHNLMRKLKQVEIFRDNLPPSHFKPNEEGKISGSDEREKHTPATQIVPNNFSIIVIRCCSKLDVIKTQRKLDQMADHVEAVQNKEAKQKELDMSRLDFHLTQKEPLIMEKPGYSCKGKLCGLRIRPEFPGYGFSFATEQIGRQFYSHKVYNVEHKSPAEISGLKAGDRIAEVNGVSVIRTPNSEVVRKMKKCPWRLTLLLVDENSEQVLQECSVDLSIESARPTHTTHMVPSNVAQCVSSDSSPPPTEDKTCHGMDTVLVQIIQTDASERDNRHICGIATLDDELYIVKDHSAEVEIYDSLTYCFVRRWTLEELVAPWDISSCNKNKCLYILNSEYASQMDDILRVAPNGILINSFSTGDDFAQCLSVTDESNVVLAICDKNKLNEYTSDGQIIREINLLPETGIVHPFHAIKLPSGQYAVCHGDYDSGLQRVCIVSIEGHVVRSFGNEIGSTLEQMDCPQHLAVDEDGNIIVADYGNSRVLLLNSDLTVARVLLEKKHGLRLPWRIHLNASNNRLFISDFVYSYERQQNLYSPYQ